MHKKLKPIVAEMTALKEHIVALNEQMQSRGFGMASDTKMRIGKADELIAKIPDLEDEEDRQVWLQEADDLCKLLRAEGGQFISAKAE